MLSYGITEIQSKPSLIKSMTVGEIVDRRAHKSLGFFIAAKYEEYIKEAMERIEREEKLLKLKKIKHSTDWEFMESGVDDGL
ncbi:MAG: hypothetical protein COB07_02050 [Sulfurovum sp.]|nr:MAG: hypothetical protein COB07_02050 [Sulfurovum sp.]